MSQHLSGDDLTIQDLRSGPPMIGLQIAARILDIGRTKAYELARIGAFPVPVRRIGIQYKVPVAPLLAYLGLDEPAPAPALVPVQRPAPELRRARPQRPAGSRTF